MFHSHSKFSAVLCDGTVVTKLNATSYCFKASEGTMLFSGKECKFPAAANSCETKTSILRI